jgi:hypothetical protein
MDRNMIIDKEAHRKLLLELLNAAAYPGDKVKIAAEVMEAVEKATIAQATQDKSTRPSAPA